MGSGVLQIDLRRCEPNDIEFLREVYASTRELELAQVPWNEEQKRVFIQMQFIAQDTHYHERFPDAAYDLIVVNGSPAGRLYVLRNDEQMRILDIAVLPQYRHAGVGTFLIKDLMDEAKVARKPLRIYVEILSPAQKFFERLGFVKIAEEGFNYLLEWRGEG